MKSTRRKFIQTTLGASSLALAGVPSFGAVSQSDQMIKKAIPSSGEKLTAVGIGTSRRFDIGREKASERSVLKEVLTEFPKLGGQLVDTAPSYGKAELVIGELVEEIGNRDDLFIATKVRTETLADGKKEIEASFERLRVDKIDMIEVHNLVGINQMLPYLRDLRAAGRIRYIGASTSSERQHADFLKMMEKEELDFIQVNYSLDDRVAADSILPMAKDRNMGVLVNLPYGRGKLFSAVGDRPLPEWAAEFDAKSWGQFFLKYIISHPAVTCAIPGTAKMKYLTDNLGAAMGRLPNEDHRKKMEEFYDGL
ncbi:MAG: aldo/keto reductase [Cyclobacteriaceae bacterium]